MKIENQTTDVEFTFSNLRLVVTIPIIERLSKFGEKIQALQKESEEAKMKAKVMEVSRILNEKDEEDSEDDDMPDQMKKINMNTLVSTQLAKKNKEDTKEEEQKGLFERLREEREKYLMQGKELKIKIIDENSRMNAKGRLKNFEIWIPLDSTDEYSRVLSLSLSLQVSYKTTSLVKHRINEILNQLIDSTLHKDQRDASVMINQFMIIMYNRHLLQVQDDLTSEKLLLPSRISMVYDKFFNLSKDSDITNIEMTIEPFDMKVGFRELENFQQIQKVFNDFQERMSKTEVNVDDAVAIEEQQELDEKDIVKNMEKEHHTNQQARVSFKERKSKQLIKMNVRVISESINFALMDDTGKHEYPLINFSISKIIADIEQETGADDAASFILKKMGISKHPYLKLDAGLLLESNYFNISSGSYEPLIEPWTFSSQILQKTLASAMVIHLKSDEMLDMCVTYGMALALKRLQTKMGQQSGQWEDEKKVEEAKTKTKRITQAKSAYSNKLTKNKSVNSEDEAEDAAGFIFENNLGLAVRITLENYEAWLDQGIQFTEEDKDTSIIEFHEWEDGEDSRNVRLQRDLISINKYVKKQQNGGKFIESFEDQILRYDVYIHGFEPIIGVPIEITGLRSYELIPEGVELKKKKPKYQHAIVVNVSPEGNKKLVSFESQLIITNKTEHDFKIANVHTQGTSVVKEEMTTKEINACIEELKTKNPQVGTDSRQTGYKFYDVNPFSTVFANTEFKVPLLWFLDEVDVYYKCQRGSRVTYKQLLPNLKRTFLRTDDHEKPYEELEKYSLIKQESIENTFVALDVVVNKCRPTAQKRPPQFNCEVKPPVCFNNMTFSELTVIRKTDNKVIQSIKPGGYAYMYEGIENDPTELNKIVEEEEKEDNTDKLRIKRAKRNQEDEEEKLGPVKLNKFIWKFIDDNNTVYESIPNYVYSITTDNEFIEVKNDSDDGKDDDSGDGNKFKSITLRYETVKFNTFIYTPYILINQTDLPLRFGEKGKKENSLLIPPNTSEFFNPKSSKKKKFSVMVDNCKWANFLF